MIRVSAAFGIIFLVVFVWLTFQSVTLHTQRRPADMTDITTLKERTGIIVPNGSRVLYFDHERGGEQLLRTKILLPQDGLQDFLSANNLEKEMFSVLNHGFLGSNSGDWDPQAHKPFPVYARDQKTGTYLYIGYLSEGSGTVIYLYWFMT